MLQHLDVPFGQRIEVLKRTAFPSVADLKAENLGKRRDK